ncbi:MULTISPECIES: helicase HerA domain-containing protein [Streptomyces]|uniref:helicase HerA domain-containing protein n=1 Tax=Streptomyces TaxID=1883 RepID=UPI0019972787|nr:MULTISPECIES: DUF87 domain-containing protein [Streptomyces]GGS97484.1 hypothetical protein GCM10010286_23040 [Streptomyces toxytricini]
MWDRFAQDNYNSVLLAQSGAGKSYLTKLELLRQLFTGTEALVIDPEDEYVLWPSRSAVPSSASVTRRRGSIPLASRNQLSRKRTR